MYEFSENQFLQVDRRVYDIDQEIVVFHISMKNPLSIDAIEMVEFKNGTCRFLKLSDNSLEASGSFAPTGYTDAMLAFSGEPSDVEAEGYLRSIGALPPVWEPS